MLAQAIAKGLRSCLRCFDVTPVSAMYHVTRLVIITVALTSSMFFVCASRPLAAETTTCDYSSSELKNILGGQLLAALAHSTPSANPEPGNDTGKPRVTCEGSFLAIDLSRLPAPAKLKLGIPTASVQDQYPFAGLASYYRRLAGVTVDAGQIVAPLAVPAANLSLTTDQWVGVQGRYKAFLVAAPGATLLLENEKIELSWSSQASAEVRIFLGLPGAQQSTFSGLRYAHLWGWLAALCLGIEKLLLLLHGAVMANWGVAIVLLAITLKLLLLPVSLLTAKAQARVNRLQTLLRPKLNAIKGNYDGEEAHRRSMAAYRSLDISPFFALRPLPGTLIQLPILVATFNVLGEMPQLQSAAFLWIDNLAYPDAVATLSFTVPAMGSGLNLLPFIMLLVSVLATIAFSAPHSSAADSRRQKRNLYLMSAAFFFLFYPFPAAMVLYWTVNNALQLIQQRLVR